MRSSRLLGAVSVSGRDRTRVSGCISPLFSHPRPEPIFRGTFPLHPAVLKPALSRTNPSSTTRPRIWTFVSRSWPADFDSPSA